MPFTGAIAPLIIDLFTHYSVFIRPESSTASLSLIWISIWNVLLILPLGLLIGLGIDRSRRKDLQKATVSK